MWRYTVYINVHLQPMERRAGSMPERMFKIIYSSPYASHDIATLNFDIV